MRKITVGLLFLGAVPFASAATLLDDGFDVGFSNLVKPGVTDWDPTYVDLGQDFLGSRGVSAANFVGAQGETFTISGGGGSLSAVGTGSASGLMELSYHDRPGNPSDFTNVYSVNFWVTTSTAEVTGALGFYTNGYSNLSGTGFTIPAGFTGKKTFLISALGGQPFVASQMNSMFLDFNVGSGGTLVLDRLTVESVPEPTTLAAAAAGLIALARRRRRTNLP